MYVYKTCFAIIPSCIFFNFDFPFNDYFPGVTLKFAFFSGYTFSRSEEHTSELQSQSNLVCRLLLEKKKEYPPRGANAPDCTVPLAVDVACNNLLSSAADTGLHTDPVLTSHALAKLDIATPSLNAC